MSFSEIESSMLPLLISNSYLLKEGSDEIDERLFFETVTNEDEAHQAFNLVLSWENRSYFFPHMKKNIDLKPGESACVVRYFNCESIVGGTDSRRVFSAAQESMQLKFYSEEEDCLQRVSKIKLFSREFVCPGGHSKFNRIPIRRLGVLEDGSIQSVVNVDLYIRSVFDLKNVHTGFVPQDEEKPAPALYDFGNTLFFPNGRPASTHFLESTEFTKRNEEAQALPRRLSQEFKEEDPKIGEHTQLLSDKPSKSSICANCTVQ